MKKGETWVSKIEGRSHIGLRIVDVDQDSLTLEVDRTRLDKTTGEVRKVPSTIVIPKEQWRHWEQVYRKGK